MLDPSLYVGREQTYLKHYLLLQYLEEFAHIIGFRWSTINYVDCFSGPWEHQHPDLVDTSFSIATNALRRARETHRRLGHTLGIRCLFLEKSHSKFARLKAWVDATSDSEVEIRPLNKKLESAVSDIVEFAREGGSNAFNFVFLDPTGWTGFAADVIDPVLKLQPGEVLVNFMTHHIRRFIEVEESAESFRRLFGADIRNDLEGLGSQDREEKLVGKYMRVLKRRGGFSYVGSALISKPDVETTFFHLIYATRHDRGIEVFKSVEERMVAKAIGIRADAKERKRLQRSAQPYLLPAMQMHRSSQLEELRDRYLTKAKVKVNAILSRDRSVAYDHVWRVALAFPLVWQRDVREWIAEWRSNGLVRVEGVSPREKLIHGRNHRITWIGRTT